MARRVPPAKKVVATSAKVDDPSRVARKLIDRLDAAEANVAIATEDAQHRGRMGGQLGRAVTARRTEVDRLRHEVRVASRLTGPTRRGAYKRLRPQVDAVEEVADRIVESAFTERLTPPSALRDVADSLDALDRAYEELDGHTESPKPTGITGRLNPRRTRKP